jgi:anti-sigma factor ChrR (cupin superfamily)
VGPPESGQVTSIVRYEPNSSFPLHDHPEGEEIFVLDGVFSDEHGDWPAGTYLVNPEGFRHAPFSRPGTIIFVKLRQLPGPNRIHVALDTTKIPWEREGEGTERKSLYQQAGFSDRVRLERWRLRSTRELHYAEGAELLVLEGGFSDEQGSYGVGTWMRMPAGFGHRAETSEGCVLFVKEGGLRYLRADDQ